MERQGARMLTQAASFFSTSASASRSAAARSGRLVNTNSVLMAQSFVHGGMAQAHAQHALQACVVQAARLLHERERLRWHKSGDLAARHTRRSRQAGVVGYPVQPLAHQ